MAIVSTVMFNSNLKAKWDYENPIAFAEEKAEHKKAVDIALKMKEEGIPTGQIAEFTKLSFEKIEKLYSGQVKKIPIFPLKAAPDTYRNLIIALPAARAIRSPDSYRDARRP